MSGAAATSSGATPVLIGHAGHAEVIGTLGQIDAPVHLVSTAEDVARSTCRSTRRLPM
jgi:4-hydroxy-3-methylbut-2-enyl diphosphate reductase